jgi:hypothetical protein
MSAWGKLRRAVRHCNNHTGKVVASGVACRGQRSSVFFRLPAVALGIWFGAVF